MGEQAFQPLKNLPGCMLPDGGECCAGYIALADDWHKQHEALKGAAAVANTAGSLLKAQVEKIDALVKALEELLRFCDDATLYEKENPDQYSPYIAAREALAKAQTPAVRDGDVVRGR